MLELDKIKNELSLTVSNFLLDIVQRERNIMKSLTTQRMFNLFIQRIGEAQDLSALRIVVGDCPSFVLRIELEEMIIRMHPIKHYPTMYAAPIPMRLPLRALLTTLDAVAQTETQDHLGVSLTCEETL